MIRRAGVVAAVVSSLAAVAASAATGAPGVRVAGIDVGGYPRVVVNVVTPGRVTRPPRLDENGLAVSGFQAVNFGAGKSIVLAVDNSQSMKGRAIRNAALAAQTFVDAKSGGDEVSIVAFGQHALQLTQFSTTTSDSDAALKGLAVDSVQGTALYDAIVTSAKALRGTSRPGRVIVLLTDGHDVSSVSTLESAVAAARSADAAVYPIAIQSRDFDPVALQTIARDTGGTYHVAGSSAALQQVYAAIGSELDRTWRLSYQTAARPGDQIDIRAHVGGQGSASSIVDVPSSFGIGESQAPTSNLPSVAYTQTGTIVLSLLVAAIALGSIFTLVRLRRGSWVRQRLAPHVGQAKNTAGEGERLAFLKVLFKATEGALGRRSQWRSVEKMLVRGDVPLRPAEFLWLIVGSALVGALFFAIVGGSAILTLVGLVLGGLAPYAFVGLKVRRRSKAFEDQLPDLLTTIAASLKAGHSFKHGLQAVVDEAAPPASIELRRVLTEAGLGRPLDDALADMAERVGSENFAFAITAVTIQRQVGGSLATLFDMVSDTVRNRQQFARKIRSLTAMGRMSAYTLVGIPFFIGGMVTLLNPGYINPLFHSSAGHVLLLVGTTMMIFGSLVLKKIVSFRG